MKEKIALYKLLHLCGILSITYFLLLIISIGIRNIFNLFWLCLGLGFIILGRICKLEKIGKLVVNKWIKIGFKIVVTLAIITFVAVEGLIVSKQFEVPPENADYVIILGAKVNNTTPSVSLKYRIEEGVEYLLANKNTKVIVSGGKGSDEGISEAQCMKDELVKAGIDEDRIIMEDNSFSTKENLTNSKAFIEEKDAVVIISNGFHIYRALHLAKELGYTHVYGDGASSTTWLIPANYVREFVAVIKDVML